MPSEWRFLVDLSIILMVEVDLHLLRPPRGIVVKDFNS